MARCFFVGGNWKMNGSIKENKDLISKFNSEKFDTTIPIEVVIAPPSVYLQLVHEQLRKDWKTAAQNCYKAEKGAFTGELSCGMLKDLGIEWVILGHSERRTLFHETNQIVGEKCQFALKSGIKVIACIGESLKEREANQTMEVCIQQLETISQYVSDWSNVVIAYEPVWAIGTGKVATPQQAQEVHLQLRVWLKTSISSKVAEETRIIYGGSVTSSNCNALAKMEDIDGFLVGGASLTVDFLTICKSKS